jgi:hypothetical protein
VLALVLAGPAIVLACGGTAGTIPSASDASAGDGSRSPTDSDGATTGDATTGSDGGIDAAACTALPNSDLAACENETDCTIVYRGCYCGAQPAIGVATAYGDVSAACEAKAAQECTLGCANAPGHLAQDGKNDVDGGTIKVRCDLSSATTGTCKTYIP